MTHDRLAKVRGAAVMQKEDALAQAPKWSSTEFIRPGAALSDPVSEFSSHVVHDEIGKSVYGDILLSGEG